MSMNLNNYSEEFMLEALIGDVEALKSQPDMNIKANIAEKISSLYDAEALNEVEETIIVEILNLLIHDTETYIRKIISQNLHENTRLPKNIVMQMAKDVAEVSEPILKYSDLLQDSDLIEIIRSTAEVRKMVAICERKSVSAAVSHELIIKHQEEVNKALIANDNAVINEADLLQIIEDSRTNKTILGSLVARGDIPVSIAEKIIMHVSDNVENQLGVTKDIQHNEVRVIMDNAKDSTKIEAIADVDPLAMVDQLMEQHKLTNTMILRSLCHGKLQFYAAAIARMTDSDYEEVLDIMHFERYNEYILLYQMANLPLVMLEPTMLIIGILVSENIATKELPNVILERIIHKGFNTKEGIMSYVISLIGDDVSSGLRSKIQ